MAKTLLEFAADCAKFGAVYKATEKGALIAASKLTQASVVDAAIRQHWPTTKKHPGGLGPIGVTTRLIGGEAAEVRGKGGAVYAYEYGAVKHIIVPRKAKALNMGKPYGWAAFVESPGFKGRPFWDRGVTMASPKVTAALATGAIYALTKTFT